MVLKKRQWEDAEIRRLSGFDWEFQDVVRRVVEVVGDKREWDELKARIIDHQSALDAFKVIKCRGAEAVCYADTDDPDWRQTEIDKLKSDDPIPTSFAAYAINQMPSMDVWHQVAELLVKNYQTKLAEDGESEEDPDKLDARYLIGQSGFDYLPRNLKNEMPKHIRELVDWSGQFARLKVPDHLEKVRLLTTNFPHCKRAVDGIVHDIELSWGMGSDVIRFRPTLLVGSPGIGKTKFSRELCKTLGLYAQSANVGGISENHLFGLSAGWHSAHPGIVTQAVASARVLNPVIILDEIDKTHSGRNGDIQGELLGLLEPEEARRYREKYLTTEVDASHVNWIFTANVLDKVSAPLRSRCKVYEIPQPTQEQVPAIINSLVGGYAADHGLRREFFSLDIGEVEALADTYKVHKSIRILGRLVHGYLHEKSIELPSA